MKYSKLMERARFYYATPSTRTGGNEIRQVEATLKQLQKNLAVVQVRMDEIADEEGMFHQLRAIEKEITGSARDIFDAKRCCKGGKALRNANRAAVGPPKTKKYFARLLPRLEAEKKKLLTEKTKIEMAIGAEGISAGLLDKERKLKKRISSITRVLGKARKRGFATPSPKKKGKRKKGRRSVWTISGGGVSPR